MVSYRIVQLCVREPSASAVCVCVSDEGAIKSASLSSADDCVATVRRDASLNVATNINNRVDRRQCVWPSPGYSLTHFDPPQSLCRPNRKFFSCATPLRHSSISLLNVSGVPSISFWRYKSLGINPTSSHSVNSPLSQSLSLSLPAQDLPFHKSFPP